MIHPAADQGNLAWRDFPIRRGAVLYPSRS